MRRNQSSEPFNFWPSVSDLMLGAFMLALLLWICSQLQLAQLLAKQAKASKDSTVAAPPAENPEEVIQYLKAALAKAREKPKVINLPEADGFRFENKKSELSAEAASKLQQVIVPKLQATYQKYRTTIDTIEVIGHTDTKGINASASMDRELAEHLANNRSLYNVHVGSNADLGLLRALAVAEELAKAQAEGRLSPLTIRVYSAANLVPPPKKGGMPVTDQDRRRVEVRLSQPDPQNKESD